jgi:hypothetical protein
VKRSGNVDRQPAAPLRIERLFHPESMALDALVDVLHLLLVDDAESISSTGSEPTCFPVRPE